MARKPRKSRRKISQPTEQENIEILRELMPSPQSMRRRLSGEQRDELTVSWDAWREQHGNGIGSVLEFIREVAPGGIG